MTRLPSLLAALCALPSCTAIPLPLPHHAALAPAIAALRHEGIAVEAPLTPDAVSRLALQNSPDLAAARDQHAVAQSAVLQAGLLPNPNVVGAILPLAAGLGDTTAWNAAISEDLLALVTLAARKRSARAAGQQVDAQILWQEWQVFGQARLLAVDLILGQRQLHLLTQTQALLAERQRRSSTLLATGDVTLATLAPDLAALAAARTATDDAQRLLLAKRHQLAALLGLEPDAPLALADDPAVPLPDPASIAANLDTLLANRPDLAALRYGYDSQDAKLRVAIIGQFPKLVFGVAGGSDNANVRTVGPQIGIDLPLFNRGGAGVAAERATRQQLHDEYAARLVSAAGQVRALTSEVAQLRSQLGQARASQASAEHAARQADAAYAQGNLDERGWVDLVSARLTKQLEVATLEQALLDQQLALGTLVGAGTPAITIQGGDAA